MEKVTICITTYNLEDYIDQAIESVLMQKTNFEYKIIVADDCSTDKTREILQKYKNEYPNIIELILNEKNIGSLANSNQIFSNLKSKYFIFLDGDDYWIDEKMLQKMSDFLDNNENYSMVGGNTYYLKNDVIDGKVVQNNLTNKSYNFSDYTHNRMPFVHTSALLVRNVIFCNGLPSCYTECVNTFENCALRGEDFRRLIHLKKGPIYVMSDIFSVYRIHSHGMWQGSSELKRKIETAISFNFYSKYFGNTDNFYFVKMKKKTYKSLVIHLIAKNNFIKGVYLPEKELKLISEYLIDMRENEIVEYKKMRALFLKILFRIIIR